MQFGKVQSYRIKKRDASLQPFQAKPLYMKKSLNSSLNINMSKIVNEKITEEHIEEARRLEDDPLKILALIDIIFMNEDKSKIIPS